MKMNESEKVDKYLNLKKAVEHEGDGDTNYSWSSWNSPQKPGKETGSTGDQKENRDHPDHSTVKTR